MTRRLFAQLPGLVLLGWLPAAATFGADDPCRIAEVRLSLTEEAWVPAETARVLATVQAAVDPQTAGTLRREILTLLRRLVPEETEDPDRVWRITSAVLERDPSGLERWRLQAEIRTPEARLPGLHERARALSKPGLSLTVALDWTPSLREVEAARARAREALYRRAQAEAARLNATLGARYRVGELHLDVEESRPLPQAVFREALKAQEEAAPTLPRADRLIVRATAVLVERECPPGLLRPGP